MVGWVVIVFGIVLIYAAVTGKGGQVVNAILPKGVGSSGTSGGAGSTSLPGASGQVSNAGGASGSVSNASGTGSGSGTGQGVPALIQSFAWDCSTTAAAWLLEAEGATGITEMGVTSNGVNAGIVNSAVGLVDGTGGHLSDFLKNSYGLASHAQQVTFEEASSLAARGIPFIVGASGWGIGGHWSGVSGFDPGTGVLSLANPSPGYGGIGTTLSKSQWSALGPVYAVIPN